MNKFAAAVSMLALSTGAGFAGGLDLSGQSITAIFEEGNYAELSYGMVQPNVSGVYDGTANSGNVTPDFNLFGGAIKTDVSEKLSFGLIFDQPFGADVSYGNADVTYPLRGPHAEGTNAHFESTGITALARYKAGNGFSIHAGVRHITAKGDVFTTNPSFSYSATLGADSGTGYVIGAAYEKPEIALRVALTYSSEVDLSFPTTAGLGAAFSTPGEGAVANSGTTLPQSINLDFQSGIAANTLVFGSIRWAEWTKTLLEPAGYPSNPLLSYDNDVITYTLGIGRKFSDKLSGAVSFGFEKANGGEASNLSPTDGYRSIGLGASYKVNESIKLSGGIFWIDLGNATTETIAADFSGNTAVAAGVKVSYSF
ncbi:MAG: transporter [Thalassovita sp.]|nr:transporter [Thalassovita sp.]